MDGVESNDDPFVSGRNSLSIYTLKLVALPRLISKYGKRFPRFPRLKLSTTPSNATMPHRGSSPRGWFARTTTVADDFS